ncbi:MAG: T9SS type A sorting domain-containing protein [Bacteroidota bacterium]
MKTKNLTCDLEQRILYLGYQKLEEETMLEKLREKINQPQSEDKYRSSTLRECSFEHIIIKSLSVIAFVISATNLGWCQTDEEIISQFEKKEWVLDNGFELPYYTFTPTAPKPANGYPLIVGLHGTIEMIENGEGGHLIRREVIKGWVTPNVQDMYVPYVLAPQAYLNWPEGGEGSWGEKDVNTALDAIIQTLIDEGAVDPDRIYILGHSVGGFGAWVFPTFSKIPVAAIAPMSGFWIEEEAGVPLIKAARQIFPGISVWAFHYTRDPASRPTPTREVVEVLEEEGISFVINNQPYPNNNILNSTHLYTEYTPQTFNCTGVECHQVCDVAIPDPVFIEWLFQQRRGRPPAKAIQITNIDTTSSVSSVSWAIENQEDSVAIYFQPVGSEEWTLLGKALGSAGTYSLTSLLTIPKPRGRIRVDVLTANNGVYGSDTSLLVTLRGKLITDSPTKVPHTKIVAYPNPAKEVLHWQGADRFDESTYCILDVLGRTVAKGQAKANEVSVFQLASGIYWLELHSSRHIGETTRICFLKQ